MKTHSKNLKSGGSLMIPLIVALLAAGLLGSALLSMATSARYHRVHASTAARSYYLAESGGAYVRSVRLEDPTLMPAGTFTLNSGDQFMVFTYRDDDRIIVRSTGIANPGTNLEARRRLHFVVSESPEGDVMPVGFDYDNDGQFDDHAWTTVGVDPEIRSTGPSGGQAALDLKGEEGQIYLNWGSIPELNLAQVWALKGGLLSYDVQVKIKPFDTGQQTAYSKHYMLGITFRLQNDINRSYGLSYFRSLAGTNPGHTPAWVRSLPASFQDLRGTNVFLVLWYRDGGIGTFELIDSRQLTPDDPVIEVRNNNPELRDYSTLLLQLKEQFATDGRRENLVSAFLQGPSNYPLWESREDMVWQDDETVFPGPTLWESGQTELRDNRLTSEEFDLREPPEIGIHIFYDLLGANLKFFDDFAIRVEGYGLTVGSQIQY